MMKLSPVIDQENIGPQVCKKDTMVLVIFPSNIAYVNLKSLISSMFIMFDVVHSICVLSDQKSVVSWQVGLL